MKFFFCHVLDLKKQLNEEKESGQQAMKHVSLLELERKQSQQQLQRMEEQKKADTAKVSQPGRESAVMGTG